MTMESEARNEFHFPRYTRGEVLADAAAHITGLTLGLIATIWLLITASQNSEGLLLVGAGLYGLGLLAMLTCSAGYNMWPPSPMKELWRRFDHAAIFIMIAGTYTPFALMKMDAKWGFTLLAVVWSMAAIGIAIKLFAPRYLDGVTTGLYLVQGWAVVVAWHPLVSAVPERVAFLLMLGGVLYTVGVVFHLWERLPFQNAIWHGFVLAAATVHFAAVVDIVGS